MAKDYTPINYYAPIRLNGADFAPTTFESSNWANFSLADLVTKAGVQYYVGTVRGGSVTSDETKDVSGGTVYSYIDTNSTVAGGSGKNGKLVKLDANGLLDTSVLPALAISETTVGTTAPVSGMQTGDVFVNTSENKSYIYTGSAWQELLTPTDAVLSVNSKTGAVTLGASDVGAIASDDLVTSVSSESADTKVPSAKAVYTFVNTNYSASGHTHVSANITDSISASSGITSSAAGLVQGKAVEAYAAKKSHTHALGDIIYTGTTGYTAGTTISNSSTDGALATAKAVYDYVDGLSLATTYAPISHSHTATDLPTATTSALGVASFNSDSFSVSSGAVSLKAATASTFGGVKVTTGNGLGLADGVISMGLANGTTAGAAKQGTGVTVTNGAIAVNFSTDISTDASSDVKAATPKAVKTYVDNAVGGATAIGSITCDGTHASYQIAHSLGADVMVQVFDSNGALVYVPTTISSNKVVFDFAVAPANATTFKVYITKVTGTAIAATAVTA